ncbi:MAG: galactokinase [Bdellovibrionaceae bacterium]|nr:galactokinase [Pseudobdellovibrionaceae bacterium]MBX3034491.1 galactokinase [Pseudobdellovibrionaceae bacterium]
MNNITLSSPTRVDLAGGTLDLWPLYCFTGGATTVNVAIDVRTHVSLEATAGEVVLDSADLNEVRKYASVPEALNDREPRFELLRTVLRELKPDRGFVMKTRSESPVGGGLGGSSSLMISILKAFARFLDRPAMPIHQMVHLAHNLEARILNTPTGTQDYYPAASGGINILTYDNEGVAQEVLPVTGSPFEKRFLLVYTGRSHHSGLNNFEVMKAAVAKDAVVMGALRDLKQVAEEMARAVRASRWAELGGLFRREYDARIRLAPAFTCPEIEQLAKTARQAGAEAVKICGAGGGGCVMLWCPEEGRETIAEACRKDGFQILNARPAPPL